MSFEQPPKFEQSANQEKSWKERLFKHKNLIAGIAATFIMASGAATKAQEKPHYSNDEVNPVELKANIPTSSTETTFGPEVPKVEIVTYQPENGVAEVVFDRECDILSYKVDPKTGIEEHGSEQITTFPAGPAQLTLEYKTDGAIVNYKIVDKDKKVIRDIIFPTYKFNNAVDMGAVNNETEKMREVDRIMKAFYDQASPEVRAQLDKVPYVDVTATSWEGTETDEGIRKAREEFIENSKK